MDNRASIVRLLTSLDTACPGGFAIALHIRSHAPTFLFQTFPVDWVEFYDRNGLVMKDPAMHWAFANAGTIRWRELTDNDPAQVMASARRHGLAYGFTAAIHSPKSRTIAGYARGDRDFLDVEIDEISALLAELHDLTDGVSTLTEQELNALQDISVRLTHGLG